MINEGQANAIRNTKYGDTYFNPVPDINGKLFIFEAEMEAAVKNKGWARQPLTEFVPPVSSDPQIA